MFPSHAIPAAVPISTTAQIQQHIPAVPTCSDVSGLFANIKVLRFAQSCPVFRPVKLDRAPDHRQPNHHIPQRIALLFGIFSRKCRVHGFYAQVAIYQFRQNHLDTFAHMSCDDFWTWSMRGEYIPPWHLPVLSSLNFRTYVKISQLQS